MLNYLLSKSLIPNPVIQLGIHYQIKDRLKKERALFEKTKGQNKKRFIEELKKSPIALSTTEANEQHYEVPTEFYQMILGPRLKYSCCSYETAKTLEEAENEMLAVYCKNAQIKDGQRILDLGCGWGSFSLYVAEHYPKAQITSVSNSSTQKAYIEKVCEEKGFKNIKVIVSDVNHLKLKKKYDRIVSIEMFEHIRNYASLMNHIHGWLKKDGLLFVHHFCHKDLVYPFNPEESWMAKHFFKDGLMPSEDLLSHFSDHFSLEKQWQVNGKHYAKTCKHWLENLYKNKAAILECFKPHYENPHLSFQYWNIFIRSCAQLFGFNDGKEWFVTHCLFKAR